VITLGHIDYANCFPVDGALLLGDVPFEAEIVSGEPSRLNRLLAAGRVQIAPCSSIEYARHHPRYRIVPDLAIASRGEVRSILLAGPREPAEMGRCRVGFPTASASSTCLTEILLARRYEVDAEFGWFDQLEEDPFERFDAALFIGDVALRRRRERDDLVWTDLGSAWTEWTGLPFVYALWQVHAAPALEDDLAACARALAESKERGLEDLDRLAARYPEDFPEGRGKLAAYWRGLEYGLDGEVREGLVAFYAMAAEIGQLERVPPLRFLGEVAAAAPA
jgi:chorismate dehydratase